MSRLRAVALAAALLGALQPTALTAAPRACPLVVDQPGDTTLLSDPRVEREMPELDLLSVDAVSDARRLTAVLRVADLAHVSPENPTGVRWGTTFTVSGSTAWLHLWAVRDADGSVHYSASRRDVSSAVAQLGPVDGRLDLERNEVRITAPHELLAQVAPIRPGSWLQGFSGISGSNWAGGRSPGYRWADGTRAGAHRVAGPSCVR